MTLRTGAWLTADRLQRAVKEAGFKPGEVRCAISGRLMECEGQPAVRLTDSERVVILQAHPGESAIYERVCRLMSESAGMIVEVEGQPLDRAVAEDKSSPAVLRVQRLVIQGQNRQSTAPPGSSLDGGGE